MHVDIEEIIKEVAAAHKTLLTPDDPILICVSLNRLLLQKMADSLSTAVDSSLQSIALNRKSEELRINQELSDVVQQFREISLDAQRIIDGYARGAGLEVRESLSGLLMEVKAYHTEANLALWWSKVFVASACLLIGLVSMYWIAT
jgi:hypothetical protein